MTRISWYIFGAKEKDKCQRKKWVSDAFTKDAVSQVVDQGYPVAKWPGVNTKSLYTWKAQFARLSIARERGYEQSAEIRRLKQELARVTEERNILKYRSGPLPACVR